MRTSNHPGVSGVFPWAPRPPRCTPTGTRRKAPAVDHRAAPDGRAACNDRWRRRPGPVCPECARRIRPSVTSKPFPLQREQPHPLLPKGCSLADCLAAKRLKRPCCADDRSIRSLAGHTRSPACMPGTTTACVVRISHCTGEMASLWRRERNIHATNWTMRERVALITSFCGGPWCRYSTSKNDLPGTNPRKAEKPPAKNIGDKLHRFVDSVMHQFRCRDGNSKHTQILQL